METTIGNSNPDLWKYVTPESVLEGIRSVVANRLSTSGSQWASIFSAYNSGTYAFDIFHLKWLFIHIIVIFVICVNESLSTLKCVGNI